MLHVALGMKQRVEDASSIKHALTMVIVHVPAALIIMTTCTVSSISFAVNRYHELMSVYHVRALD